MDSIFYVYLHRRKTDNKVFYVGKGKGKRAYTKTGRSKWWKSVADKHGVNIEIVFDNLSEKDAFQVEKDTILEFRYFGHHLVNLTDGGEGVSGYKLTEEHKKKVSDANKGKRRSAATCLAMSDSRRGQKQSPEVVAKRADSNTGKKRTEEQKTAMKAAAKSRAERTNLSEKSKGLGNPSADRNIYIFTNIGTNEEFKGTRIEFCSQYNIKRSALIRIFGKKPRDKTYRGWSVQKENNDTKTEEKTEEY